MKKIILMGRSRCGKTTLTKKLQKESLSQHKTQYINHHDSIIDTPGEYMENRMLTSILRLHSYDADVIGLMVNATDSYSIFPPNIAPSFNKSAIGIVSQIDREDANPQQAHQWLELAGCKTIIHISSYTGEGIEKIIEYLAT